MSSKRRPDRQEGAWSLREWVLKANETSSSDVNSRSRRFSGSYIRTSCREDRINSNYYNYNHNTRSFRISNFTNISTTSTASSPGFTTVREEIDPSNYSFTTALKVLQARSGYINNSSWEYCLSPDAGFGFALNSKWNEAEKYICNPHSGEVPLECLSAKTLNAKSFRDNFTNRITLPAPPSRSRQLHTKAPSDIPAVPNDRICTPIQENKMERMTRDIGTQSTPQELVSSATVVSPVSKPSVKVMSLKRCEAETGDSLNFNAKLKAEEKVIVNKTRDKEEKTKEGDTNNREEIKQQKEQMWRCSSRKHGGCLSWMRKRQREKPKPSKKKHIIFLLRLEGC